MGRITDACCDQTCSAVQSDGGDQQVDRLLEALATYRQRCVLYHLKENNPAEIDDLVPAIAAMETGQDPEDVPSDVSDDVKLELYHQVLPKLAELRVIEFDSRSQMVRYQHPPPHLEEFLDLTRDLDPV